MSSTDFFYGISDFLTWSYQFYDNVGNFLNNLFLLTGFFGFFFWMYWQRKFNAKAANDPNQIK
ncbi:MAG: hypothetical protein EP338_01920 [Bacteroidetes bacterium]|nr:MAG: hypothetical protein EP338_01920 [Bacteroidota bacterium]